MTTSHRARPGRPAPGTGRRTTAALLAMVLALTGCAKAAGPDSSPQSPTGSSVPAGTATAGLSSTVASSTPAASTARPTPSSSAPSPGSSTSVRPTTPTTPPASSITALLGREWTRIPTTDRVVALTFDAGANADGVPKILATLSAKAVPGSFFLTGEWVNSYPNQARSIGSRYRVGNHSVSHPHFPQLTDAQVRSQLADAATAIRRVAGADPAPWFRFPFGDRNARTIGLVNAAGYVPVGWTVDTLGWQGTSGGITSEQIMRRVLGALTPGEIVLMHVGSNPDDRSTLDADTLPQLIDALRARGYRFVTLDAMLR